MQEDIILCLCGNKKCTINEWARTYPQQIKYFFPNIGETYPQLCKK